MSSLQGRKPNSCDNKITRAMLLLEVCFSLTCALNSFGLFTVRETFCITPCTMKKTLLTTPGEVIPVCITAISKTGCGWFSWQRHSSHPFFSVQNEYLTCPSNPPEESKPSAKPCFHGPLIVPLQTVPSFACSQVHLLILQDCCSQNTHGLCQGWVRQMLLVVHWVVQVSLYSWESMSN